MRVSTTTARDHLSEIITRVQDPRAYCILTRHGRPVAAIVSMAELKRIWSDQDIEDVASGKKTPAKFIFGRGSHATTAEAAEAILKVQMDRRMEREVLARAGKEPVPGGEVAVEAEVEAPPVRRRSPGIWSGGPDPAPDGRSPGSDRGWRGKAPNRSRRAGFTPP